MVKHKLRDRHPLHFLGEMKSVLPDVNNGVGWDADSVVDDFLPNQEFHRPIGGLSRFLDQSLHVILLQFFELLTPVLRRHKVDDFRITRPVKHPAIGQLALVSFFKICQHFRLFQVQFCTNFDFRFSAPNFPVFKVKKLSQFSLFLSV